MTKRAPTRVAGLSRGHKEVKSKETLGSSIRFPTYPLLSKEE
jgi:hypothetical protein